MTHVDLSCSDHDATIKYYNPFAENRLHSYCLYITLRATCDFEFCIAGIVVPLEQKYTYKGIVYMESLVQSLVFLHV